MMQPTNEEKSPNRERLSILEIESGLNNLKAVCRRDGFDPEKFSELKRWFQTDGFKSFKNLHPVKQVPSRTIISLKLTELILSLSLEHPGWGCCKLSEVLKEQGITISYATVQSVLNKNGLGHKLQRLSLLVEKNRSKSLELSVEQNKLLEKAGLRVDVNQIRCQHPGELLVQDTIFIGLTPDSCKVYLQAVIDAFNNYTFGDLYPGKSPDCAVAVLYHEVLPFYQKNNLPVKSIITHKIGQYCGRENHHYELFLKLNNIEHRKNKVGQTLAGGCIKLFKWKVINDFFKKTVGTGKFDFTFEALQSEFYQWLNNYNSMGSGKGVTLQGENPLPEPAGPVN
ncbi:MAG TPA: hypothetical protein VHY08_08070 [Bacillota bacterium]|nr:hypothetical protein [Bacillota bacterium]